MKIWIGMLALVSGCMSVPIARHAWRPDPNVVAFGAAGTAMVLSLLDPEGYRRKLEQAYLDAMPEQRPQRVHEIVTSEVLDRLDAFQGKRSL